MLCTEKIPAEHLRWCIAGRLIALEKSLGTSPVKVRPIGIGKVLRRIVCKTVIQLLKSDYKARANATSPLQACTGHRGELEAAVHAIKEVFEKTYN